MLAHNKPERHKKRPFNKVEMARIVTSIGDNTWFRGDMKFIFECLNR